MVIAVYGFFEAVIVNYRPVVLSESLEASFPSSHVMIVICVMATVMLQFHYYLREKRGVVVGGGCRGRQEIKAFQAFGSPTGQTAFLA